MRIILSRKGFDSAAGCVPSPILPDGSMLSLPIPRTESKVTYRDIFWNGHSYAEILEQLTGRPDWQSTAAHLDPDLRAETYPRLPGWRPIFGQCGAAQSHLSRFAVSTGDLFLFFGWFRQTEQVSGRLRYCRGSRNIHAIWGWLQIGEAFLVNRDRSAAPIWARYHPHFFGHPEVNNTVYLAAPKLDLQGKQSAPIRGAGVFGAYNDSLCLTAPGETRGVWRLPLWFYPEGAKRPLSHHASSTRWKNDGRYSFLTTVGRGQEFIFDTQDYPEAVPWVYELLSNASHAL